MREWELSGTSKDAVTLEYSKPGDGSSVVRDYVPDRSVCE